MDLFDYFLRVDIDHFNQNNVPEPTVTRRYPDVEPEEDDKIILSHQITQFCFPDPLSFPAKTLKKRNRYFAFVLTNVNGKKRYGHCYRFLAGTSGNIITGKNEKRWGVCYCLLSVHSMYSFFENLLIEMEDIQDDQLTFFLENVQKMNIPNPGDCLMFNVNEIDYNIKREAISFFDNENFGILFEKLDCFTVVSLFVSMLLERRIIFFSNSLSLLTSCIHAAITFLTPFQWQHVFIPILPPSMIDIVCAPMPFILGVLSMYSEQVASMPIEETIFVDLDSGVMMPHPKDYQLLHPHFLYCLATELSIIRTKYQKLKKSTHSQRRENGNNFGFEKLENAFSQFFVDMLYTYKKYFNEELDIFDGDAFVESGENSPIKEFLVNFATSQMFNMFIDNRINFGFDSDFDKLLDQGLAEPRLIPEDELIFKEGWLSKKGGKSKSIWQERYFLLAGGVEGSYRLMYKTGPHEDPLNAIDLIDILSVTIKQKVSKSVLLLETRRKTYELTSSNELALETWQQFIEYRKEVQSSSFKAMTTEEVNEEVKVKGSNALARLRSLSSPKDNEIESAPIHNTENWFNADSKHSKHQSIMLIAPMLAVYRSELQESPDENETEIIIHSTTSSDSLTGSKKKSGRLFHKIRNLSFGKQAEEEKEKEKKEKKVKEKKLKTSREKKGKEKKLKTSKKSHSRESEEMIS